MIENSTDQFSTVHFVSKKIFKVEYSSDCQIVKKHKCNSSY